jgi:hypothetical protein
VTDPTGQVDIPGLAKIGSTVTAASAAFTKAYTAQAAELKPGIAFTGWAADAALGTASEVWATFMKTLADQVRSFGADLTTSAKEYQAADDAAAARLRATGSGIPAGHPAWGNVYRQTPQ